MALHLPTCLAMPTTARDGERPLDDGVFDAGKRIASGDHGGRHNGPA